MRVPRARELAVSVLPDTLQPEGQRPSAQQAAKPLYPSDLHKTQAHLTNNVEPVKNASTMETLLEDQRILLWDIDGTLMRSTRAGSFKDYTVPMLEEVFGTAGRLPEMKVSGMTDLQIVGEALKYEGFTHEHIRERVHELRESYMKAMHKFTGNGEEVFEVLPGVREVLQAVADHPRYQSALLTGNIEPAAYLKMEIGGLSDFFPLPGAFGDESHDRRDLPTLAAERIRRHLNLELAPEQFIVIGDTPNDIECAKHFGARSLAVNTGRFYAVEDLIQCKPDALLRDLSNLELVMQTLAGL
ncbi:MAG: HAD hydrolase-like protein [Acidobacteriota bacterium]